VNRSDDELDRLLARGRLSRPEKERMLDAVTRANVPKRRRWWPFVLAPAIPAIAALLLMVHRHDEFHAKGSPSVTLEAGCVDGCRAGSTLMFRTAYVTQPSVLAAWSEDSHGMRVWYFPTEAGEMPTVEPHGAIETLARGVRIGNEHAQSHYTLHMMLVPPKTYTRDELAFSQRVRTDQPLEIVP
jgi:hypothetical protein